MKIKLDENLPVSLVPVLHELGHDVDTVQAENLTGQRDDRIGSAAQMAERLLITQDPDFSGARKFVPGTHHGVILVRLHTPGRGSLLHHIRRAFENEDTTRWKGAFVVLTERKLRILMAPPGS